MREGGRIVVVSTGGTKMNFPNNSLYLESKGAIEQFARCLAVELGPRNVTVNVVSPGFTDTDMLPEPYREYAASQSPFKRIGTAAEVARRSHISRERCGALANRTESASRRRCGH